MNGLPRPGLDKWKAKQFFKAFVEAAKVAFVKKKVRPPGFSPWENGNKNDGMHDALRRRNLNDDWMVERRINFERRSPPQSEKIQLDILFKQQSPKGKNWVAAVFIRIRDARSKPKNTAHATLKNRLTDKGEYFIEFKGQTPRRRKIEAALSKNPKLRLDKNRIMIGKNVDPQFIEHLLLAARKLADADKK